MSIVTASLFVAQGQHGIQARGSPSREVAGQERSRCQEHGGRAESQRIRGARAEQQGDEQARNRKRSHDSKYHPGQGEAHAVADHQLQDVVRLCSQCHANSHLLAALGIVVDVNGHQCDGKTGEVMSLEPLDQRLAAFGADVRAVDGHDIQALAAAAMDVKDGHPRVILAKTDPSHGLEILRARAPKYHYVRFRDEAERGGYAAALDRLRAGRET